jgi:hypothetical protein
MSRFEDLEMNYPDLSNGELLEFRNLLRDKLEEATYVTGAAHSLIAQPVSLLLSQIHQKLLDRGINPGAYRRPQEAKPAQSNKPRRMIQI